MVWGAGFFDLQVRCTGDFGVAAHANEEFEADLAGFEDGGFDSTGIAGDTEDDLIGVAGADAWGARGYNNLAPGDAIFFDWDLDNLEQIKSATYKVESEVWNPGDTISFISKKCSNSNSHA